MDPQPPFQLQIPVTADSVCGKLGCVLFEHLPLSVVATDRQGRLLAVNPEACRMFASSAERLLGRRIPGLDAENRAALHGLLAGPGSKNAAGPPQNGAPWRRVDLTLADDVPRTFTCRYTNLRSAGGEVCGLVGFFLPADHHESAVLGELHRRNAFIESILENLPTGLAVNSLDMTVPGYINSRFREMYSGWNGSETSDLGGFMDFLFSDVGQREERQSKLLTDLSSGNLDCIQWNDVRMPGCDGATRVVQIVNKALPEQGLMISLVHDVTDRKQAEDALRESERRYQVMAEASPVGIFQCDARSRCSYVNQRWREITGQTIAEASDAGWLAAVHPQDRAAVTGNWDRAAAKGRFFRSECRFLRQGATTAWVFVQAEPVHDVQQRLSGFIGSVTDITERKRSEEEIRRIAYYDPLTHLPNRTFFLDQLRRTLASARRSNRRAALLFCDLDNFKDVNDTLGHDKGDQLLKGIAERLSACVRQGDTLSRLGGDEFVLLLPLIDADRDAVIVARKIQEELTRPFHLDGQEVYTSPSIGIAIFPDDGQSVGTLLKHADTAMYAAKARGRNRYQFFREDMNQRIFERMQLEAGLRQAAENREFEIVYQPQYRLATGRLESVEALLRWRHPERGYIPPVQFIPLAEETGLIHEIGAWVLRSACVQVKEWLDAGYPGLRVAVNLSARQFAEPGLVETVRGVLAETGLPASVLELEITESVLMHDADLAVKTIEALRADGVGLTIDDFGAGYSSLKYLKNIPVNRLKIDKAFVSDIARDPRDTAIVAAIIELGRSLGLDVVAEGVETPSQAAVLRRLKCPMVQGFYFARPQTREAMTRRLAAKA